MASMEHSLCSSEELLDCSILSLSGEPESESSSNSSSPTVQIVHTSPTADAVGHPCNVEAVGCMIRQQLTLEQMGGPAASLSHAPQGTSGSSSSTATPGGVSCGVRSMVVSWMVEVAEEFRLQQESLHLAVVLLDRFLSSSGQNTPSCVLQLLAVACILLATKEHEVTHPSVQQLCAVAANHFQPHDLLRTERVVLDILNFRVSWPSSYTFLHLFAQSCGHCVSAGVLSLAMYLTELAVVVQDSSAGYSYSCRATAALLLAQLSLGLPQHTAMLCEALSDSMGGLAVDAIQSCMASLLQLHHAAFSTAAAAASGPASSTADGDVLGPVRAKFGAACWCGVSAAAPLAMLPAVGAWACA